MKLAEAQEIAQILADVFDLLRLEWVEPRDRTGPEALRPRVLEASAR